MSKTLKIGNIAVSKIGLGLMRLTWNPNPVPYDQAFDAIKAAVDAMPAGVKLFINSGEFYSNDLSAANLDLLAAFFEKYPGYADRTFLSVKGGFKPGMLHPDASEENLRRSVDNVYKHLRGTKKVDLFQCARVDPNVPIEESTRTLQNLIKEGRFDYIGLSEVDSTTVRKAHAIHPITAVEIEVSPWAYRDETRKVIATSEELGIAVVAYSPLGRGFVNQSEQERIIHNGLKRIAERKKIWTAQLCIAWVASLGDHVMPLPGSSNRSRVLENLTADSISLTKEELEEIVQLVVRGQ